MTKRFPRQTHRSYRTDHWTFDGTLKYRITREEILQHVRNTCRCDADPIFNELAHQAAMNGLHHNYTGEQGVSFTQPTTKPKGYFSILKWIIANPKCTKREIDTHFCAKSITTVDRLCAGGLIKAELLPLGNTRRKVTHFSATDLGKVYALAATRYLVERK